VPGYGHYHVWIDTAEMPTSLAGLVLMPGTNAFTLDLSAWGPGEHQIRVETAQNDHTMYDPATAASFTVIVSDEAVPATESSPAASQSEAPEGVTIEMTDALVFTPDTITIAPGQSVTWVNASAMPHTTTADAAKNPVADQFPEYAQVPDGAEAWDSGMLQPGESFSYTFTVEGTYNYFCIPHVVSGMRGTILVVG
jgi:plastocyanin